MRSWVMVMMVIMVIMVMMVGWVVVGYLLVIRLWSQFCAYDPCRVLEREVNKVPDRGMICCVSILLPLPTSLSL